MATGPDHYREAEHLLAESRQILANNDETNPAAALLIAEAQVHATLALAAATAMNGHTGNGMSAEDFDAWDEAAGVAYVQDGGEER